MPPTTTDAAMSLAVDAVAMSAVAGLRAAGVRPLLLKGVSIERWLYDEDEGRTAGDVDLLVAPAELAATELHLSRMGYASRYDGASPAWAAEHADVWLPGRGGVPIDLHRRLWGMEAGAAVVWEVLWASRATLLLGGVEVDVLGPPARALGVALHAAHHGPGFGRALEDLHRAVERLDFDVWEQAMSVAALVDATPGLSAGLALDERGSELRDRLGLAPAERSVVVRVAELWSEPRTAEGFLRLLDGVGTAERLRLLRRELFPSPGYMAAHGRATRGPRGRRAGLARAYMSRWLALARSAPSGLRAARRIRRSRLH